MRLELGESAAVEPVLFVLRGRIGTEDAVDQKPAVFQVVDDRVGFTTLRCQQAQGNQVIAADFDIVTDRADAAEELACQAVAVEARRAGGHPRAVAQRHDRHLRSLPAKGPQDVLAILPSRLSQFCGFLRPHLGQQAGRRLQARRSNTRWRRSSRRSDPSRPARPAAPARTPAQAGRWHRVAWSSPSGGRSSGRTSGSPARSAPARSDPDESRRCSAKRPQVLTGAHQRVALGEQSVGVVARDEEVEAATGELFLADQVHAQDHGLSLGVQRPVGIRGDPRRDSPAVGFVAGRHQAVHLSRAIDVFQQRLGQLDLHRRVQQLLPVATDSLPAAPRPAETGNARRAGMARPGCRRRSGRPRPRGAVHRCARRPNQPPRPAVRLPPGRARHELIARQSRARDFPHV